MEKTIFEQMGGTYHEENGYLIPNLTLPSEEETQSIGIWGQRRLRYLKEHKRATYTNLLTSGKLNNCLSDIDRQADDMFFRLVKQIAEYDGITETLKSEKQIEWVKRMNNIRNAAQEVILKDLIYS